MALSEDEDQPNSAKNITHLNILLPVGTHYQTQQRNEGIPEQAAHRDEGTGVDGNDWATLGDSGLRVNWVWKEYPNRPILG